MPLKPARADRPERKDAPQSDAPAGAAARLRSGIRDRDPQPQRGAREPHTVSYQLDGPNGFAHRGLVVCLENSAFETWRRSSTRAMERLASLKTFTATDIADGKDGQSRDGPSRSIRSAVDAQYFASFLFPQSGHKDAVVQWGRTPGRRAGGLPSTRSWPTRRPRLTSVDYKLGPRQVDCPSADPLSRAPKAPEVLGRPTV